MTMNDLFELVLEGSQNFLQKLEECNQKSVDSDGIANPALLSIQILLEDQEISITPSQDQVALSLQEIVDKSLEVVKVKRFEENELFVKFTK